MRVAVDATSLLGPRTGVGVFTHQLLQHIERPGVDVSTYATSWRGRHQLIDHVPGSVRVVRRPQAARPLRAMWMRIDAPPIEWWTGSIDVVHGPNYVVPPTRRAASVVTIHDLTFHRHPELSTRDTLQYPTLIARALRRGAFVHTDSQFVADEIGAEYGIDSARVTVVHLGIDEPPPADPARGVDLAGGEHYILAVGTVEPRKDFPLLIDAFDLLAAADLDLRVVVAGPDGWGAQALTDRIAASPFRDRIVRLGWVSDTDRSSLLRGARVLAYPSVYEGFGFPPLEAMTVGTPVVATAVGALPEILGDGAVLVPAGDAERLSAGLESLFDDTAERAQLIERGRKRAATFSWEACADGLVELYGRAAEART